MSKKNLQEYGVHWFRRDLRVAGNQALRWNRKKHQGRVVGLFCFDQKFLDREDFSWNRFAFFLKTLKELRKELRAIGSDLLVLDAAPQDAFPALFESLKNRSVRLPSLVSWNRDYEPFARKRDAAVLGFIEKVAGIPVHSERDHLLIEPEEIVKAGAGSSYYQIYSAFNKKWLEVFKSKNFQERIEVQKPGLKYLDDQAAGKIDSKLFSLTWSEIIDQDRLQIDHLETYLEKTLAQVSVPIPDAGSYVALARLRKFQPKLGEYASARDFPAIDGTSRMSIYLKNGSFTASQILAELDLIPGRGRAHESSFVYLKEIVWREFFYHILFHCPRVETEAFLEKYKSIHWENREDLFMAWKEGRTGYPIVDAGMRQLNQTGWMHNRLRMIVASFLTKDLLIDWRWGENYFMKQLLDGDLAPNNGGWQWAASTGCDAQPYFRIFNPVLQSKKFDPNGDFIRHFVPEIRDRNAKQIHEPIAPIVQHASRKIKALALYRP